MADYNIYIRTISGDSGEGSAVKPFQTGGGDGFGAGDASQFISKAGAFMENPDSAFGAVKSAGVGAVSKALPWVGVAIIAATALWNIGNSIYSKYNNYVTSASGDYEKQIKYNNFKRAIHIATHPISMIYERELAMLEIRKANARNNQEQFLTGGTILNNPYGRYL